MIIQPSFLDFLKGLFENYLKIKAISAIHHQFYIYKKMESKRQQQFARIIQKDLSEIFQRDAKHMFGEKFITITMVRVTPDLGIARVYLSFLMTKDKEAAIEDIQEKTKTIRQLLAQKIRNSVRVVPELHFYLDDTADYVSKIDALLDSLDIPPEEDNEQ